MAETSRLLGVARSTAHRLLAMLAHYEFVVQNEHTRAYHAGPALVALGSVVAANDDVHSAVRPHLETLASTFGETVHVCTLRGADVVFLGGVESTKALRAGNRTGTVLAAHATSGGKAMLALPALTRRTIRTRTALLRELQHVRERGFAINDAESEAGLYALSCTVLSRTGELRGAITISGPQARFRATDRARMVAAVRSACKAAGAAIR